ncbi:hypothetical protein M422DRAFT_23575 [Sphaerobolus stellatus SS14]|nr:hypothetical protein M422DRAFT_23575 [Sphaerobolus stellatus SS14]
MSTNIVGFVSFGVSYILQGVLFVQGRDYLQRSWRFDTSGTRYFVSLAMICAIIHNVFFGVFVYMENVPEPVLFASYLIAKLLSVVVQIFFAIRVHFLPWRYEYLALPLLFFVFCSVVAPLSLVLIRPDPVTFHRIKIASGVFILIFSAWSALCIFFHYFIANAKLKTKRSLHDMIVHSSLPGTFFILISLILTILNAEGTALEAGGLVGLAGCVQAVCMMWALGTRPEVPTEEIIERSDDTDTPRLMRDLAWTRGRRLNVSPTVPRRVTLLPLHSRSQAQLHSPTTSIQSSSKGISPGETEDAEETSWRSNTFAKNAQEEQKLNNVISEVKATVPSSKPLENAYSDTPSYSLPRPRPVLLIPPPPKLTHMTSAQTIKSLYSTESAAPEAHDQLARGEFLSDIPAKASSIASTETPSSSFLTKSKSGYSGKSVDSTKTSYTITDGTSAGKIPIAHSEDGDEFEHDEGLPRSPIIGLSRAGSQEAASIMTHAQAARRPTSPASPPGLHPYANPELVDPFSTDVEPTSYPPVQRGTRIPGSMHLPTYAAFIGQPSPAKSTTRLPFGPSSYTTNSPSSSPLISRTTNPFASSITSPSQRVRQSDSPTSSRGSPTQRYNYSPTGSVHSTSSSGSRTLPERAPIPTFSPPQPEEPKPSPASQPKSFKYSKYAKVVMPPVVLGVGML